MLGEMPDGTKKDEEVIIYRLSDIDTKEVSIVDAAANRRKFLVVKGANMSGVGAPVVSDGKGGYTVAKDTPAPPAPSTEPGNAPPAPPPSSQGLAKEPKLTLAPEAKAELIKRFSAAIERLSALKALVEEAEEVEGIVEVPETITTKVAELLNGISQGDVSKEGGGAPVLKGLPQFSAERVAHLRAAYEAIGTLLGAIAPAPVPPPATEPSEVPTSSEAGGVGDIAKMIANAVSPLEEKIGKGLDKIITLVMQHDAAIKKQGERVEAVEKASRPTPRSGTPEGVPSVVPYDSDYESSDAWPVDMADPDRYDVSKVDPSIRFTKAKRW